MLLTAKDFDQPGSKESNPITFKNTLTDILNAFNHSTSSVDILTTLIDKYIPKHYSMRMMASVFAMLVINSDKGVKPNLEFPYDPLTLNVKNFAPYISKILPAIPKGSARESCGELIYRKYEVDFLLYLFEYSNHVEDYFKVVAEMGEEVT